MMNAVEARILRAQQDNLARQQHLLSDRSSRGGKTLCPGDLAYFVSPHGRSQRVHGPYVVERIAGDTVHMRSTAQVSGQAPKVFDVHRSRVARCFTVVDAMETLLRAEGMFQSIGVDDLDELVAWHQTSGGVSSSTRQMS